MSGTWSPWAATTLKPFAEAAFLRLERVLPGSPPKVVKTKAGIPFGIFGSTPESLEKDMADGCTFPLCGVDSSILSGAYRELAHKLSGKHKN